MPNDLRGGDNITTPVKKAASAPEGDNERLRNPWPASKVAMRVGINGTSDALKLVMVENDHPWEIVPFTRVRPWPAGRGLS